MNKTPLNELHKQLNAKMVDFYGWELPVRFTTIIDEYFAVRKKAGIFDVFHMGIFFIRGEKSEKFLDYITANDVGKLNQNQVQYSMILNNSGKILDDILITKYRDGFYMVVNGVNVSKIEKWLNEKKIELRINDVYIENFLGWKGIIAIQGRFSADILQKHVSINLNHLRRFYVMDSQFDEKKVVISRTGYTGEDGFEIIAEREDAVKIWEALLKEGVKPCGLGARDILRLEAAFPLYGNELSEDVSPLWTNVSWVVKLNKKNFIGREALLNEQNEGIKKKLIGLKGIGKVIARKGHKIKEGGVITSGTLSPFLGEPIALAFIDKGLTKLKKLTVIIRDEEHSFDVVELPFYKKTDNFGALESKVKILR